MRIITDSLPGPVARVDNAGRYIFVNAAYTDWFGFAPSELIGKTPRDVLGPAHYQMVEHHYRAALDGERRQFVRRIRTQDDEALKALRRQVPDLVLMDFEMPTMDGIQTIRAIRKELQLERLPVLMLTGHSTRQVAITSIDAGARDFIVKPYQRAVLLEKIRSCLEGGRRDESA